MPGSRRDALPGPVIDLLERRLSPEEFARLSAVPITDVERHTTLELVAWFTRRYPTPLERLAYVRRARARWLRTPRAVV